jgi:carbon-monoxide dehydrogenase iron sulfur subunit
MSDAGEEPSRTYVQIDYRKCTGCRICEMICSIAHGSTAPSHARIHVDSVFPGIDIPSVCKHCIDPPCFECSFDAMVMKEGVLVIDDDKCVGCGVCAQTCPIGAITIVESKAAKCDLCGRCVELCPTQALSFCETVDEADLTVPGKDSIMKEILGQEVL